MYQLVKTILMAAVIPSFALGLIAIGERSKKGVSEEELNPTQVQPSRAQLKIVLLKKP